LAGARKRYAAVDHGAHGPPPLVRTAHSPHKMSLIVSIFTVALGDSGA